MKGPDEAGAGRTARLLEHAEKHIGVDGALVRLIQHDHAVVVEVRVQQALTQEHTIRHVSDGK